MNNTTPQAPIPASDCQGTWRDRYLRGPLGEALLDAHAAVIVCDGCGEVAVIIAGHKVDFAAGTDPEIAARVALDTAALDLLDLVIDPS